MEFTLTNGYGAPNLSHSSLNAHYNDNWSMAYQLKTDASCSQDSHLGWGYHNVNVGLYHLGIHNNSANFGNYNGGWQMHNGSTNICDGEWHTIAVSHGSNQSVTLYVDGVAEKTVSGYTQNWNNGGNSPNAISFHQNLSGGQSTPPVFAVSYTHLTLPTIYSV